MIKKRIINANIFTNTGFIYGSIDFTDKIEAINPQISEDNYKAAPVAIESCEDTEIIDAKGNMLIPGLIDIHTHGAIGVDYNNADKSDLSRIEKYYLNNGITSVLATLSTISEEDMIKRCSTIGSYISELESTVITGINLEGPFLSPSMCGSQNTSHLIAPDISLTNRLIEEADNSIRLITVAPELDGAIDYIRRISSQHQKLTIALGHTMADYATSLAALNAGASHLTHIYNRMTPISHKEPGIIPAAIEYGATAEIICDGVHVHDSITRMTLKLFEDRLAFISDTLLCAGLKCDEYDFAGVTVDKREDAVYISGSNNLAGACRNLMEDLRHAVSIGIPLEQAIRSATIIPAGIIKMDDRIGSLELGKLANMVMLTSDFDVERVFLCNSQPS